MSATLIYCYDAYCGWCYGFSSVIKKIHNTYKNQFHIEVLSGGMILGDPPKHISVMASYIQQAYKKVEELTGVKFGSDYLWHINHSDLSDWHPDSEKPAIAMCIFKEMHEDKQIEFATDLQYSLNYEGRDLCDDEAYRHLLEKYDIEPSIFYDKLHSNEYKQKAYNEFSICKQLKVTGFPCLLLQINKSKFNQLSYGYTDFDLISERLREYLVFTD